MLLHSPVAILKEQINSQEYLGWVDYLSRNPVGHFIEDLRFARLMCLLHNIHSKKPSKVEDWLIRGKKNDTALEMKNKLIQYCMDVGGKIERLAK